ncbi:MAG TPA: 2-succinyl-5-enolpyruvyl-6-hydroxy-3-cyclohexene-1-carboxylic-acid synthase [Dehalococcoidia bacterium]|nr:2-succinyl-5-enolpyruvyl-6-hydroxy-3-cyclohexene-1-carboxylic-acid synthase [Dehalococcoidia bacterium]
MDNAAANTRAARALIRGLARTGVRHACVTPGSRSTPLTVALSEQSTIRPWLHLDERSSAFFALGLARATGSPVAIVCTSGTAAANLHPAVAEADLSRIPLVMLTADRPPSLRGVGAAQTIDQVRLFGNATRWWCDLPLPSDGASDPVRFESLAERAVRLALGAPAGPVHLNTPFDEPLIAAPGEHPAPDPIDVIGTAPEASESEPARADVEAAVRLLARSRRPLLVAGPETGGLPADEICRLAERLDAPILADPLSGLRTGAHDRERILDSYDAILRDDRASAFAPDAIVRLGAIPTSKALGQFMNTVRGVPHVLIDRPEAWRDPFAVATTLLPGSPAATVRAMADTMPERSAEPGWTSNWLTANAQATAAMQAKCVGFTEAFEGRVFPELQSALPEGTTLMVGNSMPVRDADSFLVCSQGRLEVIGNRGANGIDGVISSAAGTAAAGKSRVVLVVGDLSFYHDMNGLWAAKKHSLDLTVVLINNKGGGIFHYLPQAAHSEVFEDWFGTPSGLDFAQAAELYGSRYFRADEWDTFREGLNNRDEPGLTIIEVPATREANVEMHKEAWAAAADAAWNHEGSGP